MGLFTGTSFVGLVEICYWLLKAMAGALLARNKGKPALAQRRHSQ